MHTHAEGRGTLEKCHDIKHNIQFNRQCWACNWKQILHTPPPLSWRATSYMQHQGSMNTVAIITTMPYTLHITGAYFLIAFINAHDMIVYF